MCIVTGEKRNFKFEIFDWRAGSLVLRWQSVILGASTTSRSFVTDETTACPILLPA